MTVYQSHNFIENATTLSGTMKKIFVISVDLVWTSSFFEPFFFFFLTASFKKHLAWAYVTVDYKITEYRELALYPESHQLYVECQFKLIIMCFYPSDFSEPLLVYLSLKRQTFHTFCKSLQWLFCVTESLRTITLWYEESAVGSMFTEVGLEI